MEVLGKVDFGYVLKICWSFGRGVRGRRRFYSDTLS